MNLTCRNVNNLRLVSGCFVADLHVLQRYVCVRMAVNVKSGCLSGSQCQVIDASLAILKDEDMMFFGGQVLRLQGSHAN